MEKQTLTDKLLIATTTNQTAIVKNLLSTHRVSEQNTLRAAFWWACRRGNLDLVSFIIEHVNFCNQYVTAKIDLQFDYGIKNAEIGYQDHVVHFLKICGGI